MTKERKKLFIGFYTNMLYLPSCLYCSLFIFQAGTFRGDTYLVKLAQLENFLSLLSRSQSQENTIYRGETDGNDDTCCICYACEADAEFSPCSHRSCYGCITRHLLNSHRCFFCNATVVDVVRISEKS